MVTVVPLGQRDEMQASIDAMRRNAPVICEHARIVAGIKRAYFQALVVEGFSEAQALELCKGSIAI